MCRQQVVAALPCDKLVDASTHAYCHNAASTRPACPREDSLITMADKANPLMFSGNAADMLKQYGQAVPDSA